MTIFRAKKACPQCGNIADLYVAVRYHMGQHGDPVRVRSAICTDCARTLHNAAVTRLVLGWVTKDLKRVVDQANAADLMSRWNRFWR